MLKSKDDKTIKENNQQNNDKSNDVFQIEGQKNNVNVNKNIMLVNVLKKNFSNVH
jgi:hypothetical protein